MCWSLLTPDIQLMDAPRHNYIMVCARLTPVQAFCSRVSVTRFSQIAAIFHRRRNEMKKASYIPTAEEQALAESKRRHRQEKKQKEAKESKGNPVQIETPSNNLLSRPWLTSETGSTKSSPSRRVTIFTWNVCEFSWSCSCLFDN